jgi:hypothetical protein
VGAQVIRGAIFLTIDLDLVDHMADGSEIDECGPLLEPLLVALRRHPQWKVTWLVRLDGRIEQRWGDPTRAYAHAQDRLRALLASGHELGWHPHAYVRQNGQWRQNCDPAAVAVELRRYGPIAHALGLRAVRMGWAYHHNATIQVLAELGFMVDSTAIPRPVYDWDRTKDWSTTPREPYWPSIDDYRVPGPPSLSILEVPMSVAPIPAPYDKTVVVRYLNPAYRPEHLRSVLESWFRDAAHAVLVTHPHELIPRARAHGLIASSVDAFEENVAALEAAAAREGQQPRFAVLSEAPALLQ